MWNPFTRKKSQGQGVEDQFRTRLVAETRVGEDGFDAGSVRARASFERIVAQPRDDVRSELVPQRSGVGRVVHSRRVRFAFAFVFVLVGIGGGVNVFLHQDGKKEDILTRAQAEYEDKQGIIYIRGTYTSYDMSTDSFGKTNTHRYVNSPVDLWGTSDGLYAREVTTPRIKSNRSGALRWEFLDTPDGSCYTSSDQLSFASYSPIRQKPGRGQIRARSCPVGLGLRPRVHLGDRKAREYQTVLTGSRLPVTVSEAVLHTGKLLRRILAGKFQRHTVEEITERGRRVYRVKAWRPAIVYNRVGQKKLLQNDFTVETLILDKKTLRLLRYEERTDIRHDGQFGERSLDVNSFVLDQTPRFYSETKANYHLLRTQFAPSRVDYDPYSKDDLAQDKRIGDAEALKALKPWIKAFAKIHHRRPTSNEIHREIERRRRSDDALRKFIDQQLKKADQGDTVKAIRRRLKQERQDEKRALER